MSYIRVTQALLVDRALTNLSKQTQKILTLQEQLATGQRVNAPSDDPLDARRAVNARTAISKNEQYLENITAIEPQLTETSSSISTIIDSLLRVYELTLQGANGTYSQVQLDEIAIEVNQILESVLDETNHVTNGRYVFGGTVTQTAAFEATRDADGDITAVTYNGNDEHIEIAISDNSTVVINETGTDAFLSTQDIFQLLIDIRDDLEAGDQASLQELRLGELDTANNQLLLSLARIGSVQERLEDTQLDIEEYIVQLEKVHSDAVDADYAETVINLNAQNNAFQAALSAAAQVIQPSLLDYIG